MCNWFYPYEMNILCDSTTTRVSNERYKRSVYIIFYAMLHFILISLNGNTIY